MRNKNAQRQAAEQLNTSIDRPDQGREDLPPADAALVDALQRAAARTKPRPGFVNELAQELSAREKSMTQQANGRPLIVRLLAGGVTVAGMALLIVAIAALFARGPDEPALEDVDITPPDQVEFVGSAQGGFLDGVEIQVVDAPSTEPQQLAGYTFQPTAGPQTPEEARAIAARFGLDDVRIYRPALGSGLTAFAADGRSLTLADWPASAGFYYGFYYSDPAVAVEAGEALPYEEAAAVAEAFLQPTGFLPAAYELEPGEASSQYGITGVRVVRVVPLLDGHPVIGNESMISVNGAGEVVSAYVAPFAAVPTGETIEAGSARDALQRLLAGPEAYSYSYNPVSAVGMPRIFSPPPPSAQSGDTVTVSGWPIVYTDVENGEQLVQLSSAPGGVQYFVEGLALDGSGAETMGGGMGLAVTGTLGEQLGPRSWRLSAADYEPYGATPIDCRTGSLERLGDGAYLVLDDGETRYPVPNAPEALENGARIELCAEKFEPDTPLSWVHIASPPSSEVALASGVSGGSVKAVQVEPTITPPEAPMPPEPGSTAEAYPAGVTKSVSVVPQPAPMAAVDSPYEIGDTVEVTGRVNGMIWLEEEEEEPRYEIFLTIETDGDLTTYPFALQLQGERALLDEIAQHYFLHVAVQGTVVENESGGQALQVESFERVWPEEEIQAFLGHKRVETVDGRQVIVFTDEATGERFVTYLNADMGIQEEEERRVLVTGAIHPEVSFGGLRLLEVLQEQSGDPVDQMQSADELPVDRGMPVFSAASARGMGGELGDTLVVERIVLGYQADSGGTAGQVTLAPAWLFYGRNPEGTIRFTVQLPLSSTAGAASPADSTYLVPTPIRNEQPYPYPSP